MWHHEEAAKLLENEPRGVARLTRFRFFGVSFETDRDQDVQDDVQRLLEVLVRAGEDTLEFRFQSFRQAVFLDLDPTGGHHRERVREIVDAPASFSVLACFGKVY